MSSYRRNTSRNTYNTSSSSVHCRPPLRLPPQSHPSTTSSNAINTVPPRQPGQRCSNNMDGSYHMSTTSSSITELDLSKCHPRMVDRTINAVPGLKTSAAFFTFLRANLVLPHSGGLSLNPSTPYLEPYSARPPPLPPLPPLSRSPSSASSSSTTKSSRSKSKPTAMASTSPATVKGSNGADISLDDIPPLSLSLLTTRPQKTDALRLIADSIAQQRQQASYHLITHPLLASILIGIVGVVYQFCPQPDWGTTLMLLSGVVMCYLMTIRYFTSGYIKLAEAMSWEWLINPNGAGEGGDEEDLVLGTYYGDELIGALVLRLEPAAGSRSSSPNSGSGSNKARKSHSRHNSFSAKIKSLKGGRGVIRAWTTKLRYRGRGVGRDLLIEAVRLTREKCGKDAEVGFAAEHANANSGQVLPERFCKGFRKGERRAAGCLEAVLAEVRR